MQYRVGKCGGCGATFKVPATFKGDQAKCKSCEDGVVAIGPVEEADPVADVRGDEQEEDLVEHRPSGKKDDGPSMLEKLRAQRAAEQGQKQGAKAVPARRPASRRPAKKVPAGKNVEKDAQKGSAQAASGRRAAGQRPARPERRTARKGAGEGDERPSRARAGASGRGSSRSSARRAGGTRARRGEDDEDEDGGSSRRGRAARKKKSPAPLIGALVLLVVVGVAAWQMLGDDEAQAAEDGDQDVAAADAGAGAPAGEDAADESEATDDAAAEGPDEEAAGEPDSEDAESTQEEPSQPTDTVTPDEEVDPSVLDLSSFEPLEKDPECSEEEWERIQELATVMADEWSPKDAAEARDELCAIGRFAYPAMVNEFLKVDFTTRDGRLEAGFFQRAMEQLLGGRNYGWKTDYENEPNKTTLFNKKVVEKWYVTWKQVKGKPNAWNDLSKNPLNTNRPDEEDEKETGLTESDQDDLDEIDF